MLIKAKSKVLSAMIVLSVFAIALVLITKAKENVSAQTSEDPGTQVTVANEGPEWTSMAESPASTAAAPTNVSSDVTFVGTATDDNSDDWFLAVCKTAAVSHNGESAPTCTGGAWCVDSTEAASGASNSCSYTVDQTDGNGQSSSDEQEEWYAYACDAIVSGSCTAYDPGTPDDSETPFYVNHRPEFTGINKPNNDPGGSITFTATYKEQDADGAQDTIDYYVCSTNSATAAGCAATTICSDTDVTPTAWPDTVSCNHTLDSVMRDGDHHDDFYAFIFDSHDLQATTSAGSSTAGYQTADYTVDNVAPVVSTVAIDVPTGSLDLDAGGTNSTETVTITGTVSDANNCHDFSDAEGGSVKTYFYRGSETCAASGDADDDSCYPELSCTVDGGTCTGDTDTGTDADATYTCTVTNTIQYHADPTVADTPWASDLWWADMKAIDDDTANHTAQSGSGIEVNDLLAAVFTGADPISYGSFPAGGGDTELGDEADTRVTVEADGNVAMDAEFSGDDMTCTTGLCSGNTQTIVVGQQQYGFSSGLTYDACSGSCWDLTGSATEQSSFECPKTYDDGSTTRGEKTVYWGIEIPATKLSGLYSGTNYITVVVDELTWP